MNNVLLSSSILVLFGIVGGFLYSPFIALQGIDKAMQHNDVITLNSLVNIPMHRKIAATIIEGKLKIKKILSIKKINYKPG